MEKIQPAGTSHIHHQATLGRMPNRVNRLKTRPGSRTNPAMLGRKISRSDRDHATRGVHSHSMPVEMKFTRGSCV